MRPSLARDSSRNARTSRPRSPTSASTVRSALVLRAIMPISVLLPTPLPPKIPMRWPRPQVRNASTARMPQPIGSRIDRAPAAAGAGASSRLVIPTPIGGASESSGWPMPSMTRPSSAVTDAQGGPLHPRSRRGRRNEFRGDAQAAWTARWYPRNPTISPGRVSPVGVERWQSSPTEQNGPSDSTRWPTTWVTRPSQRRAVQGFQAREIGGERCAHDGVPGRASSRSRKPCSISPHGVRAAALHIENGIVQRIAGSRLRTRSARASSMPAIWSSRRGSLTPTSTSTNPAARRGKLEVPRRAAPTRWVPPGGHAAQQRPGHDDRSSVSGESRRGPGPVSHGRRASGAVCVQGNVGGLDTLVGCRRVGFSASWSRRA